MTLFKPRLVRSSLHRVVAYLAADFPNLDLEKMQHDECHVRQHGALSASCLLVKLAISRPRPPIASLGWWLEIVDTFVLSRSTVVEVVKFRIRCSVS